MKIDITKFATHFTSERGVDFQFIVNIQTRRLRLFKRVVDNKWEEVKSPTLDEANDEMFERLDRFGIIKQMEYPLQMLMNIIADEIQL